MAKVIELVGGFKPRDDQERFPKGARFNLSLEDLNRLVRPGWGVLTEQKDSW